MLDAESLSSVRAADFKGRDVWLFDEGVLNYEHLSHARAVVDCFAPFGFVSFPQLFVIRVRCRVPNFVASG